MTQLFEPDVFQLTNSIRVFAVTAKSFPDGVAATHEALHGIVRCMVTVKE